MQRNDLEKTYRETAAATIKEYNYHPGTKEDITKIKNAIALITQIEEMCDQDRRMTARLYSLLSHEKSEANYLLAIDCQESIQKPTYEDKFQLAKYLGELADFYKSKNPVEVDPTATLQKQKKLLVGLAAEYPDKLDPNFFRLIPDKLDIHYYRLLRDCYCALNEIDNFYNLFHKFPNPDMNDIYRLYSAYKYFKVSSNPNYAIIIGAVTAGINHLITRNEMTGCVFNDICELKHKLLQESHMLKRSPQNNGVFNRTPPETKAAQSTCTPAPSSP